MNQKLTVFIEYKVKPGIIEQYEHQMQNVLVELKKDGAGNISWLKALDQDALYVESFDVGSRDSYQSLKQLRLSESHPVYGPLEKFISGGMAKLHCWAFEKKGE
ncbi:hypothetical protein [Fictibacillus terranigra]|uniref:ABM domain-containing protein n=1 Tax=Fictibacillus terranigra TaxID=3058424 RepID=A0ABT8EBE2_9BACL|nr:hypothetical protein [Fictibacillus sp. CENA-BCM004]MDN4075240.1 hypothetical protein [Fictibacillus sp. CENA-BCM004]